MRDDLNPYAAPTSEDVPKPGGDLPTVELFTPKQVGIAAFLASAAAGTALIAVNEWRLGRRQRGVLALLAGAGFLALIVAITEVAPQVPGVPISAGGAVAAYFAAKSMFGKEVEDHVLRGIPRASGGAAVGWALMGLAGGLAVIFGVSFVFEVARLVL